MKRLSPSLRWTGGLITCPDVHFDKMPPDDFTGGRDRHVRGVTAPIFQNPSSAVFVNLPSTISSLITPDSTPPSSHFIQSSDIADPSASPTIQEAAIDLFKANPNTCSLYPLTPCASTDNLLFQPTKSTSTLLQAVFPEGLKDVEGQYEVSATLPGDLKGVLVDQKQDTRSLYVLGLGIPAISNQCMTELLDLAYEKLEADEVVFVLRKDQLGVRELVQGLMYVGGHVIRAPRDVGAEDRFVMVGIEL